jgi:hypothetical protein
MIKMNLQDFSICMTIVVVILFLGLFYNNEVGCDSYKMFNVTHRNGVNGVYFQGIGYYCVWTEGRGETQINRTDTHERCNDLIYKDYEHFCENE